MNCPYCQAANSQDDHRCQRCGRRMDWGDGGYGRQAYGRAATAPALHYETEPETSESSGGTEPKRTPFQPSLFQSRLVSFESFSPESVEPRGKNRRPTQTRTRPKREIPGQESFHFETVITHTPPPARPPEASIGFHSHVAHQVHRLLATAFDLTMVSVAVGLFWTVFYLVTGSIVLNVRAAPLVVGTVAIFYLMYELLWSMADLDTAGMRVVRLKLVNFEGGSPDRDRRLCRVASACLSLLSVGLGVVWAFVDEEALTWHDHISKTFPTPY